MRVSSSSDVSSDGERAVRLCVGALEEMTAVQSLLLIGNTPVRCDCVSLYLVAAVGELLLSRSLAAVTIIIEPLECVNLL